MSVDDNLRESHLTLLYIRVVGHYVAIDGGMQRGKLGIAANHLQAVAREDDVVATGYVDALMTTQYAADMHTEAIAQAQVGKTMTCPSGVFGHVNVGYMYVSVEQMTLVQRLLESENLLLYVARAKVLHKEAFHQYALLLESSGQNHYEHYRHGYGEQEGIGESCEIVADIENERRGYDYTHKDGDKQRQTIAATLAPQRTELLGVILLHDNGTQEGAMIIMVSTPHIPFAHQCMPGIKWRTKGRKNVNIRAMAAMDKME